MKKIIYALIGLFIIGCSSSDSITEYYINIQIDKIPQEYANQYSFTDFKIAIYSSKEDYFNETNPIHVGNFDSLGKFSVSKNINSNSYYIDIFTSDFVLSNWQPTDLNVASSNVIVFLGGDVKDFYVPVGINDQRSLVGEWTFVNYDGMPQNPIVTERSKLVINKDFSIKSYESYNGIDLTVNYDYNGLKYVSTLPSESDYPYNVRNPDGLYFIYDKETKILNFHDYAAEYPLYKK